MTEQDLPPELKALLSNLATWQQANDKATLYDIENAVDVELDKLRSQLMKRIVEDQAKTVENVECPQCGAMMMRNGKRRRKLKGRGNEELELEREQWRCHECGMTIFPPG